MKKQTIKINESQLQQVIKETIENTMVNEGIFKNVINRIDKWDQENNIGDKMGEIYGKIGTGIDKIRANQKGEKYVDPSQRRRERPTGVRSYNESCTKKPLNESYASQIEKWNYFCLNFPHDFIQQIWGGTYLEDHFQGKFNECYKRYGSEGAVLMFYIHLDGEHRRKLESFAMGREF